MLRNSTLAVVSFAAIFASSLAWSVSPDKIEWDLRQAVAQKGRAELLVVIYLRHQHTARAAELLSPIYQPRIDFLGERFRLLATQMRGIPSLSPKQEAELMKSRPSLFDRATLEPLAVQIDEARTEYADAVAKWARANSAWDFQAVRNAVASVGGRVTGETLVVSAVIAKIPAHNLDRLAQNEEIATIGLDHPGDPELDVSGPTVGAPAFWGAGVNGGPQDIGVLDTGVSQAHPAFAGFLFEAQAGTNPDSGGHGTHVCGIMGSKDPTRRGMAWGAGTISVGLAGGESTSMQGLNWMMVNVVEKPEDTNHSFGYGTANGVDYRNTDQFFDGACDTFGMMVSKSNGNNGYGTTTLTHPAPAYNLLAVGCMNDFNTLSRSDDRISSFSSSGPTLAGRKKPDLCAPGENIMSTSNSLGFVSMSGTSMAAPHAGGSIVLLMALGAPSPLAAKAVLINSADAMDSKNTASTADDLPVAGSHWDKAYGWGYLNLNGAYLHGPDVFERILASPNGGARQFRFFKGLMSGSEKVTLTWNRHVAWNGSSYPTIVRSLSNLDLRAFRYDGGDQVAASQSTIDNVEQVSVPGGMTVFTVSAEGNFDPNVPTERFALATQENFVEAAGPAATVTFAKGFASGFLSPFDYTATVKNTGDLPMLGATVKVSGYQVLSGDNPMYVGGLLPGQSASVHWTVKRTVNLGQHAKADVTSVSFGEGFVWSVTDPAPL
ncbi:MAG: S8 family serine peptidase [Armatimonadetes bacterium]|nr:S8 family serine peptidase [Armatimonadota bacterium]